MDNTVNKGGNILDKIIEITVTRKKDRHGGINAGSLIDVMVDRQIVNLCVLLFSQEN